MFLLDVKNISKSFQDTIALQEVSIEILPNKIYGLLGPNGAGKTTLIRNITQIFYPDKGEILFKGEKLKPEHQNKIGYMPEEQGMYKKMKVGDQLLYFARLRGFSKHDAEQKIDRWLKKLNIESWRYKTIEELSKGMQQKVQFVATVLHEPELLILDEPFSGLDPINADVIKNEIFELQQQGTTIIFSTHRMENVEEICEDIFLIDKGKIILEGNVQQIKQQYKENLIRVDVSKDAVINSALFPGMEITEHSNSHFTVKLREQQKANDILKVLLQYNIEVTGVSEILPTIHEIFISTVNSNS